MDIGDNFEAFCGDKIPSVSFVDFKTDKAVRVFQGKMGGKSGCFRMPAFPFPRNNDPPAGKGAENTFGIQKNIHASGSFTEGDVLEVKDFGQIDDPFCFGD